MFTKKAYLVQAVNHNNKAVTFVKHGSNRQDAYRASLTDSRVKRVISMSKIDQPTTSIGDAVVDPVGTF